MARRRHLPFLGRPVAVRLDAQAAATLLDAETGALQLPLPRSAEPAQIRDAVQSWLQRQARRLFEERCQLFAQRLGVRWRLALSSGRHALGQRQRRRVDPPELAAGALRCR